MLDPSDKEFARLCARGNSPGTVESGRNTLMKRDLSLPLVGQRVGLLAVLLFVSGGSALYAQTKIVGNSKLDSNTPQANGVLLQNSVAGHGFIPDPESILGHKLLHKVGAFNAAAQKASPSAPNRGGATPRFFITDLGTLGGTQ